MVSERSKICYIYKQHETQMFDKIWLKRSKLYKHVLILHIDFNGCFISPMTFQYQVWTLYFLSSLSFLFYYYKWFINLFCDISRPVLVVHVKLKMVQEIFFFYYQLIHTLFFWWISYSLFCWFKCQIIKCYHKFPDAKVASSNCLFFWTNSLKHKDIRIHFQWYKTEKRNKF